ncbi:MAG: ATP-binding cassette domain-containing protein [Actinomyces sp.]|nr:MAG: ATP-binding cassette domain-containing protein [Actinomyces sp.]
MLILDAVSFAYPGGPRLFDDLTAAFACDGEIVGIAGPSGSGKTTLLALIGGLLEPDSGRVLVDGVPTHRRAETFAWVFQTNALLGHRSALDNVMLPLVLGGAERSEARSTARGLLDAVDLGETASRRVRSLSGGERQRLALVRALAQRRPHLLVDEPTAQLDRRTAQSLIDHLRVAREYQRLTVIVSHDPAVWDCCDRVLALQPGGLGPLDGDGC